MTLKTYLSWHDVERHVNQLAVQLYRDNWKPDYIVGLTRGGLVPAVKISHYLDVPMHSLSPKTESNCWMAEEALGYVPEADRETIGSRIDPSYRKKILIIDDINDTGATLNWIREDWKSSCLPNDERWNDVWGNNVRVAVIVDNQGSNFKEVDYAGITINKLENPVWVVFPWEAWWEQ